MEKKNFGYSMKNIPVAGRNAYLKCLTEQVEYLVRRMRLKVMFYNRDQEDDTESARSAQGVGLEKHMNVILSASPANPMTFTPSPSTPYLMLVSHIYSR